MGKLPNYSGDRKGIEVTEYYWFTSVTDLDVYGFLKHYRDLMGWSDPVLETISTKDAQNILELYWRNKIADEILDKHDMLCTGNNCLCKVIATQVKRG
jgi:hypothetical protein